MSASRLIQINKSVALSLAGKGRLSATAIRQLGTVKNEDFSAMVRDVSEQQRALNAQVVPWFMNKMPVSYYVIPVGLLVLFN